MRGDELAGLRSTSNASAGEAQARRVERRFLDIHEKVVNARRHLMILYDLVSATGYELNPSLTSMGPVWCWNPSGSPVGRRSRLQGDISVPDFRPDNDQGGGEDEVYGR